MATADGYRLSVDFTLADQVAGANGKVRFIPSVKWTDATGVALGTSGNPIFVSTGAAGDAVTIADGADVTQGAIADAVVAAGATGTLSAKLRRLTTDLGALILQIPASLGIKTAAASLSMAPASDAVFPSSQSGTWNITNVSGTVSLPTGAATAAKQPALGTAGSASSDVLSVQGIASGTPLNIGGAVASGAADSGNPVKIGGKYNSTLPTFSDGNRGDLQIGSRGSLQVAIFGGTSGNALQTPYVNVFSATLNTGQVGLGVHAVGYSYDGSQLVQNQGDTNGAVNQPYARASSRWVYAGATGGIVNSTAAVTFIAAAGAGVRNYVAAIQFDWDALGAATELVVRDGAAGTVLWRRKIPAGVAGMDEVVLPVPLKGTANTLMEVATLTASVTGGVYFNAQGFQGT